jgi:hypothetical protein
MTAGSGVTIREMSVPMLASRWSAASSVAWLGVVPQQPWERCTRSVRAHSEGRTLGGLLRGGALSAAPCHRDGVNSVASLGAGPLPRQRDHRSGHSLAD